MTPAPSSSSRGAVLALLVTILIWAYSWIAMKQGLQYAGPFDFSALRYALGALVLFGALLVSRQSLRPPPLGQTALIGVCQIAAFQSFGQLALLHGGAGHVALLAYTMPFWAVLLAWLMLREPLTPRHGVGLGLAALGLVCIIEPWHGLGKISSTLLALGGGAAWGAGSVLTKRLLLRHALPLLNLTAWQMLFGTLALAALALCIPQRPIDWGWAFIGDLAYCGILASSVAWGLWLIVLRGMSTTRASMGSLGVPVTSVLMAWAILGERPGVMELIGIVFVLLGLAAISGLSLRRHRD